VFRASEHNRGVHNGPSLPWTNATACPHLAKADTAFQAYPLVNRLTCLACPQLRLGRDLCPSCHRGGAAGLSQRPRRWPPDRPAGGSGTARQDSTTPWAVSGARAAAGPRQRWRSGSRRSMTPWPSGATREGRVLSRMITIDVPKSGTQSATGKPEVFVEALIRRESKSRVFGQPAFW